MRDATEMAREILAECDPEGTDVVNHTKYVELIAESYERGRRDGNPYVQCTGAVDTMHACSSVLSFLSLAVAESFGSAMDESDHTGLSFLLDGLRDALDLASDAEARPGGRTVISLRDE